MYQALLLAAVITVGATGCAERATEATSPAPGTGREVQVDTPFSDAHDTRARALAQTDKQRRAQANRMRQQLRAQGIDGSVAIGIAAEAGYKITTLQAEEAAEALRLGRVEGGEDVVIERATPIQITTM